VPEIKSRQIIALGGGGFSMEPDNLSLDRYILQQSGVKRPKVCFIGTASGDSDRYLANFYAAFASLEARPSHLPLFQRTPQIKDLLLKQDVIYVGGGNTVSMLAVWQKWGLPDILSEAWQSGILLAGISAGAMCWFEQGLTDSSAGELRVIDCLGFVKGSFIPHYDGEAERRQAYHAQLLRGMIVPGLAADDGAAVHFRGEDVWRVVRSRQEAQVYRVGVEGGEIKETVLETVDYSDL
jgi:dipeptidase E